ncbi:MAG: T9SS type A sorting domain-containing protein [Saprospiraceae bacterium]|nr:T9SS type A sorting domain-containing protein [Saprospiraceae bacterium]
MKRTFLWLACLFCCLSLNQVKAQSTTVVENAEVSVTYAQYLGKTPPLRNLIPMALSGDEKLEISEGNKEAPNNFAGRGKYESSNPYAKPLGPDPLWQTSVGPDKMFEVEPLVNIEGISSNFGAPNDPTGDIGADHFLQAVNATTLAAFDKEGNLAGPPFAANTIWNSIGFSSAGDPIIMYDQEAGRWIITEFPFGNQLLFAISDDSDPFGSYTAYNFGTPSFPDYPKYGVWSNAYSVTTNEGGPSSLPCYFINRQQMLDGAPSVQIQRIVVAGLGGGPGFQVATPVDWSGLTPPAQDKPLIVTMADDAWSASNDDAIRVHEFDIDWANSNNTVVTTTTIITSPFDSNPCSVSGGGFSCVPQGGNGGGLDALPEVIMNQVHYRNFGSHEAMVMNFITDVSGGGNLSGIRWVEMRRTGGNWELYQEGTWAPNDGLDRYMGAIAMDGNGNIGLAYSASSENTFVGLRYTGRRASDPLGEMTVDEYIIVNGTNTINSGTRYGDYAHMSIDPTNDRTFWYTSEYAGGGGVDTRIVAFELGRDTTDIGPSALVTPQSADDLTAAEMVQIQVKNYGLDTQSVFQVGYIFENGTPVIDMVNYQLFPDSVYTHTFGPTVDMATVNDYEFVVFTSLADDESPLNDTLRVTVSKLPRWDAGISNITGLEGIICQDPAPAQLVLTNYGTETLTQVNIDVTLNAAAYDNFDWTGSLAQGESTTINLPVTGFIGGANALVATTSMPNGMVDEVMINDEFTRNFDAVANAITVFLNILTDNYPGETTWELAIDGGATIYTGGPYPSTGTLYTTEWCLDPEECYTFTIFDAYGDGICCNYGLGNYNITDENGNVLVEDNGEFSFFEVTDFCATFECMLDGDVDISPESAAGASDGALMITPMNGTGPYQYSIDGGNTFQSSNTFNGLPAGTYNIVIIDGSDCTFEATVTVPECALTIMVDVTNESGAGNNGTISISVSGANNPVQYSIDGGNTFQTSPDFGGLTKGTYTVVVRDGIGCVQEIEVEVDLETGIGNIQYGYIIEMFPNPTDGAFRINVEGLNTSDLWLPLEIYTIDGKLVQATRLVKYDQVYTGMVSLVQYPDGIYLVRFIDENINRMLRVVKQK